MKTVAFVVELSVAIVSASSVCMVVVMFESVSNDSTGHGVHASAELHS